MSDSRSFGQALRSTTLLGATSALSYLVGLIRVKIIAVLLGPGGVGIASLYISATGLISTIAGAGLPYSGVRSIAQAHGNNDLEGVSRVATALVRAAWFTGLSGLLLTICASPWLSQLLFENDTHAVAISLTGATVLLGSLSGARTSLLQGTQRIGDIARISVSTLFINTALAIAVYAVLREQGIVPVLIGTALVNLIVTSHFSARVTLPIVAMSQSQTIATVRTLASLGLALMWSALLTSLLDVVIRATISRNLGVEAAGHYQAAWTLSGLFAGFVLNATVADYYPRLSASITDSSATRKIINHQAEIGLLLSLPGLLGTLALAPYIMQIFYTRDFQPGTILLPWLMLGVMGRVVSWPLSFVQLALGLSRIFFVTETLLITLQATLTLLLLPHNGLVGAAQAFAMSYACYFIAMYLMARKYVAFRWSPQAKRLLLIATLVVLAVFIARELLEPLVYTIVVGTIALLATWSSLRELAHRLGSEHRLSILIRRFLPGVLP